MDQKSVLQQLKQKQHANTMQGKGVGKSFFSRLPGYRFFYRTLGQISAKGWFDMTLFFGGVWFLFNFSDSISRGLDEIMPNEQKLNEMIKEMQAQGGPPAMM